jgi:hypothetical protein
MDMEQGEHEWITARDLIPIRCACAVTAAAFFLLRSPRTSSRRSSSANAGRDGNLPITKDSLTNVAEHRGPRSSGWASHPNLRLRPHAPNAGRGRLQVQVRRPRSPKAYRSLRGGHAVIARVLGLLGGAATIAANHMFQSYGGSESYLAETIEHWHRPISEGGLSPAPLPAGAQAPSYFEVGAELEGDLTAGPLLLPGNPGTLAAS